MHAEPQPQHQWLHQLVGEWTSEMDAIMGPDQPPAKFTGKETVRSLGGLWVIGEGQVEMPGGGTGHTVITLGYDPAKQQFVGSFIGSMMAGMWLYSGQLEGNVLTLDTEGPSFADPNKLARYQDIVEIINADHRQLRSRTLGEDGKWVEFMTVNYRRIK